MGNLLFAINSSAKIAEDGTVTPRATLVHVLLAGRKMVAGLPWNGWPLCRGMGGRIGVESVARLPWNRWPLWRGIGGHFAVEYAQGERAEGKTAVVWQENETTGTANGKPVHLFGTETAVLEKSGDGWTILHVHWSSRKAK
jgi:hypothetical protein